MKIIILGKSARKKHQILTSSDEEASDVELEDQQKLQVLQIGFRVTDSVDTKCICEDLSNLKLKVPPLSRYLA